MSGEKKLARGWRAIITAGAGGLVLCLWVSVASAAACSGTVDASDFATATQLKRLVKRENSFGPRILASKAHNKTLDWITDEVRDIDGFKVRSDRYMVYRWQPRTKMQDGPGLDISRAGAITATAPGGSTVDVPDAGAVRFSEPTGAKGQSGKLAYLPSGQAITAANAAGKVVIRDFPSAPLPYAAFPIIGLYITPDLASATGNYDRPYLGGGALDADLLAAGEAGAAGVVFAFDVPRKQVTGYYDPHTGTKYGVPGVFVGRAQAEQLKALAAQGASASVAVRAKLDRAKTANVIATLPGRSKQKIALFANTDGNSWVQEDGVSGHAGARSLLREPAAALPAAHPGDRVHHRPRRDRRGRRLPLYPAAEQAVRRRARSRSRSPSSTSARARSFPPARDRTGGSSSQARAIRSCSPPATVTRCVRARSRRPNAASSIARPS